MSGSGVVGFALVPLLHSPVLPTIANITMMASTFPFWFSLLGRDDQGRTALHWAVTSKHAGLAGLFFAAALDQAASAGVAANTAKNGGLQEDGSAPLPPGHPLMDTTPLAILQVFLSVSHDSMIEIL